MSAEKSLRIAKSLNGGFWDTDFPSFIPFSDFKANRDLLNSLMSSTEYKKDKPFSKLCDLMQDVLAESVLTQKRVCELEAKFEDVDLSDILELKEMQGNLSDKFNLVVSDMDDTLAGLEHRVTALEAKSKGKKEIPWEKYSVIGIFIFMLISLGFMMRNR